MRHKQRMNKNIQLRSANEMLENRNNRSVQNNVNIAYLYPSHKKFYFLTAFLLTLILLFFATCLYANPTGGNVVAGQATIAQSPNLTTIDQSSNSTIINWQTFSIGNGETTLFNQPSASSIALNRVITNNASNIFGSLKSNGQVWLINPSGILFGKNATVNVGGLIATTADIKDNDFMAGNYHFVQGPGVAHTVVNQGMITAKDAGLVALVAPGVENDGVIQAKYGRVTLASGNEYTVDLNGDQLISLAVTNPVTQRAIDADGNPVTSTVTNTGKIIANGGTVMMTANVAAGVVDNVINTSGIVQANTIKQHNGEIIIGGGDEGTVAISGKLVAAGKKHGTKGGLVQVTGKQINLSAGTNIDVSGDVGGGQVYIGGSDRGKGPLPNAQAVYVDPTAVINADAITNGDGGHIVVWSDDATRFYGTATAKGGAQGGNGGWIETSGGWLDAAPTNIDTSAPLGNKGNWLLDPQSITISNNSDNDILFAVLPPPYIYQPAGPSSNVNVTNLTLFLSGSNVTVSTNDLGAVSGTADITVNAPISVTIPASQTSTLTLDAANSITIASGSPITNTGPGILNLVLTANDQAQSGAVAGTSTVTINDSINIPGGTLTINNNGSAANGGNGGAINMNLSSLTFGSANISTTGVNGTAGSGGGSGGNVSITITNSSPITLSNLSINASGGNGDAGTAITDNGGYGGKGGAISITTSNDLTLTSPIFTANGGNGGLGYGPDYGNGGGGGGAGSISFTSGNLTINSPYFTFNGGTGGNAGIGFGPIFLAGAGGSGGNGGSFSASDTGNTTITSPVAFEFNGGTGGQGLEEFPIISGSGGNGGSIIISTSSNIDLETGLPFEVLGGVGGNGYTNLGGDGFTDPANGGLGGNGGTITFTATNNILLNGATLVTDGGTGGIGGSAGSSITGYADGGNGGMAGPITLTANGNVTLTNSFLILNGASGGIGGPGGMAGGSGFGNNASLTGDNNVTLTSSAISTIGATGADETTNGGNGGNISITSNNNPGISITLSGLNANGGASGGTFSGGGTAGNIIFTANNDAPIQILSSTLVTQGGAGGVGGNAGSMSFTSATGPISITSSDLSANGADSSSTDTNGGNANINGITITSTGSSITSTSSTYNISGGASGGGTGIAGLAAQIIFQAPTVNLINSNILSTGSSGIHGTPGWVVFGDTINLTNPDFSNAVNFSNNAVSASPVNFSITDTGSITDANLPPLALFFSGNITGMNYSITSNTGDITLTTPSLVDGTNLTLDSVTGNVTVNTDLGGTTPLVGANFIAGNTITTQNVTSNGSQVYNAPIMDAKGNFTINNAGTPSTNNFTVSGGVFNLFNSSQITTNGGSVNINSKIESNTGAEGLIISPTVNGNVNINNLVGDINPLSAFTIPNANTVVFTSPVELKGNFASTESTQFTTNPGASITTNGGSISIIGGTTANIDLGAMLSSMGINGTAGISGVTGTAGTAGTSGGDVTITGLSTTFSNSGINASGGTGGTGGDSSSISAGGQGGAGGNGGSITVTTAGAQTLVNTEFNSSGGNGGNGGSSSGGGGGGSGGKGGNAGTNTLSHNNLLTLTDAQLFANGGVGGNGGAGGLSGATGGKGGSGAAIAIIGNNAGATLNSGTASVISSAGGNAGSSTGLSFGAAGGDGGSISILEANLGGNETFNDTTISSAGGAGSASAAAGGNGGASGTMTFVTDTFSLTNSPINVLGGAGGAGSPAGAAGTTTKWNLFANTVNVTETGANTFDFSNLSKLANESDTGNPVSVSFTQDLDITDAVLPPITQFFSPNLTNMTYNINSTGSGTGMGSVTVDPNEFANSLLTIQANNNITLTNPLSSISKAFGSLNMTATNGSVQMDTVYTADGTLSVFAGQNIVVNAGTSLVPTTIGSAGGILTFNTKNGDITLGDFTTVDSGTGTTTFNSGNDITLGNNDIMNTNGSQLSLTAFNNLSLGNNDSVTTNNGVLSFTSKMHNITLGDNTSLNSGTGTTTFNSGMDITLGMSDLITTANSPITFNSNTITSGNGITIGTLSKIISNGNAINLTSTSSDITLGDNSVLSSVGGPINLVSGQDITLDLNSILSSDGGNITLDRVGNIELGVGSSITPVTGNISFLNGKLIILDENYALSTAGGSIFLSGAITGTNLFQLALDAGTGNITFSQTVPPATIRSNILVTNAKNVSNAGSTFFANNFTQITGGGATNFGIPGLAAADNIDITNLTILGNYSGHDGFLTGVNGDTAHVDFASLVVDGSHGGQLTGNVNGSGGSDAALFTQLGPNAQGIFTMNGCLVGIGCDEEESLFDSNPDLWQLLNPDQPPYNEEKPCTFDQQSGQTDMKANSDCAPISIDKRLQITAFNK